jgi:hypothetical protein
MANKDSVEKWAIYPTQSGYRIYPNSDFSGGWITAGLTLSQANRIVDFHNRALDAGEGDD